MSPVVRRHSLRFKFVIAISALVAVVLLANGLVQALAGRRILESDIEKRARAHAALAVGPVCSAYELYFASGFSKFRELVQEVAKLNPDLAWFEIYDTSGKLLFDSRGLQVEHGSTEPAAQASPVTDRLAQALRAMELSSWSLQKADGPLFMVVAPYVEEWGRHRYSVASTPATAVAGPPSPPRAASFGCGRIAGARHVDRGGASSQSPGRSTR